MTVEEPAPVPHIVLYELAASDGASPSPYVWRIKLCLARKGIAYESRKLGFVDIPRQFGGRFRTVPVVDFGDVQMNESATIADYLDRAYSDHSAIFSCPAERGLAGFFDAWLALDFFPKLLPIYTLDVHDRAASSDRDYYRRTREARLGRTLEAVVANREDKLPAVRQGLAAVRQVIDSQPYLGGDQPNYADMCMLGTFIWIGTVGTLPLLAADDPLLAYAERGLASFGEVTASLRLNLGENAAQGD